LRRPYLALSLAASLLAGTALARDAGTALAALPDLTAYALLGDAGGGAAPTPLTVEEAAGALKDYDVIFFGEWHDHPGNHLAEMDLFRAIYARAPALALSMEQFERDVQPVVDDYMASRIGEEALIRRGRAWSNYAESYRPLVEYAKDHGLPVIAANAPASVVRCVGLEGPEFLARLGPDKRNWAAAELHLADGPYRDKFMRFLEEDGTHGGDGKAANEGTGPSPAALRSFAAQVTRDDTMAESIFLYLQKNPGHKVVHVTGAFHAEGFLGTVERLRLRAPDLRIAVVDPVQVDDPGHPALGPDDAGGGNFFLLLRSLPKSYVSDAERKADEARERRQVRTLGKCTL